MVTDYVREIISGTPGSNYIFPIFPEISLLCPCFLPYFFGLPVSTLAWLPFPTFALLFLATSHYFCPTFGWEGGGSPAYLNGWTTFNLSNHLEVCAQCTLIFYTNIFAQLERFFAWLFCVILCSQSTVFSAGVSEVDCLCCVWA